MPPIDTASTDYLGYAYAAMLGYGGLMGKLRRGSTMSLVAGLLGGAGAAYGASRASQDPLDVIPAIGVAWSMCAIMGFRFATSWKFMPAGLVMIVSFIVATAYTIRLADQDMVNALLADKL